MLSPRVWTPFLLLACAACAAGGGDTRNSQNVKHTGKNGVNGAPLDGGKFNNATGTNLGTGDAALPMPPNCGNGDRTRDEACDDGNKQSGDGCSADCLMIETGYSCQPPGK